MNEDPADNPPPALRVRTGIAFGNSMQTLWSVATFLMLMSAVWVQRMHFDFVTFLGTTERIHGDIRSTHAHRHTGRHGHVYFVYEARYRYFVDGETYYGEGWSNRPIDTNRDEIEYLPDDPGRSRLLGTSSGEASGIWLLLGIALMTAGIGISSWRWSKAPLLAEQLRQRLQLKPKYAPIGWYPKVRLNRDGALVVRIAAPALLFLPVCCLLGFGWIVFVSLRTGS